MPDKKSVHGFSLLEILVALAIFAVVSVTAYHQMRAITLASVRMEEKHFALWVAENVLEQYFVERKWPPVGEEVIEYEMADREWQVSLVVSETDNKDVRRLDAKVYAAENTKGDPIITLMRFIGKN